FLHQPHVVHMDAVEPAIQRQDDRQPDRHLPRRDRDGEDAEQLPREVLVLAAEGDEIQVGGVHHQFDRHQDDDGVAARQDADHAEPEEEQAQHHHLAGRDRHRRQASSRPRSRARTIAPTIATRSSTEAISNGRSASVKSAVPTASRLPVSGFAAAAAAVAGPSRPRDAIASIAPTARSPAPACSTTRSLNLRGARSRRLTSRMTNRNSTMMPPAYTSTCTAATNSAWSRT